MIRTGLRLLSAALLMITVSSFYHGAIADWFSLGIEAEMRFYRFGILGASVLGGYGVVMLVLGLILSATSRADTTRLLPSIIVCITLALFFFYLLVHTFCDSSDVDMKRLRPGETITI